MACHSLVTLPNWALQLTGLSVAALPLALAAERRYRWADEGVALVPAVFLKPLSVSSRRFGN
jgi:hypothetical protein